MNYWNTTKVEVNNTFLLLIVMLSLIFTFIDISDSRNSEFAVKDIKNESIYKYNLAGFFSNKSHVSEISLLNFNNPSSSLILSNSIKTKNVPLTGNVDQMKFFYRALKTASNQKIRIAHYGDSILLGDVITEYLRECFQKRYGGNGTGLLPLAPKDNAMRRSTLHSYSDDWEFVSIFTRNPDNLPLGVNGSVSIPSTNSWVKYETTSFIKSLSSFEMMRLFYSHGNTGGFVEYTLNESVKNILPIKNNAGINEEVVSFDSRVNSLNLRFVSCQNTNFFGVSLENGNGIYVDNFPITGNSGVNLVDIPLGLLKEFDTYLNYKLIILNFGVNVGSQQGGTYTLYENKMLKVINHLKSAFPETSILIVSVADRTIKRGSQLLTDPEIPLLLTSQERIAKKGQVAFWNLFEAMGGKNSMVEWVNSGPPLAAKDYRHFTHNGGEIVAGLLYNAIVAESN
ncbi:MAG: hypothetical protein A2V66_14560 [Ignavibacteria bacterium RBG_13_36_8]|nr:MAG: hypothetical protein A2V66_14560 [Ignavibacteria bacterium RBG_13_36_8]